MKNMKTWVAVLVIIAAVAICGWYAVRMPSGADVQKEPTVMETEPTAEPAVQATETPQEAVEAKMEADLLNHEEEQAELMTIEGEIVEVTEEYVIIKDAELGEVQVNLNDDTVYEGIDREELAAGQFASVIYDGMMTRSLPPQINALSIRVDAITGTVAEVQEDGRVLINRTDLGDQVLVALPEGVVLTVGETVTIYTNGVMTMSLPPQVNAIGIVK